MKKRVKIIILIFIVLLILCGLVNLLILLNKKDIKNIVIEDYQIKDNTLKNKTVENNVNENIFENNNINDNFNQETNKGVITGILETGLIKVMESAINVFNNAASDIDEEALQKRYIESINENFIYYEGRLTGTQVQAMLHRVMTVNEKYSLKDDKEILVVWEGNVIDVTKDKTLFEPRKYYEVKLLYDNQGYLDIIDVKTKIDQQYSELKWQNYQIYTENGEKVVDYTKLKDEINRKNMKFFIDIYGTKLQDASIIKIDEAEVVRHRIVKYE